MNIGVFLGNNMPQAGGSFTFEETVINALMKSESRHKLYFFYYGDRREDKVSSANFITLSAPKDKLNNLLKKVLHKISSPLQKAVMEYNIELMWFIYSYEHVDIPFVCTLFDLEHRIHPFFPEVSVTGSTWDVRENYYKSMLPKAAYVIVGTETGKGQVSEFYQVRPDRVKVLPYPTPFFASEEKNASVNICAKYGIISPYLFYPAQFWPHKNHIALLHALGILRNKYALDFSAVFTGSDKGNLKYVEKKTEELDLMENVLFLGFVPRDDLVGLYKNAFAMVFTSFFGPDNIPPLEAFALGCPVVASDVSGAKEQLGNAALFFDPRREDEIASAIKRLNDDLKLRGTLIERGLARIEKRTAENYVKGMFEIIDDFESYRRCWSSKEVYHHI